jgi:dTMP kinase
MPDGKFLVIEGTDGSGKGTQCKLLLERMEKEGMKPAFFDFPRYGNPSAYFVEKYLNGGYGELRDTGPRRASTFYALDRFDASVDIWSVVRNGGLAVANRYVASNMGHQGSKMNTPEERRSYYAWLYELEYTTFAIPKPTKNIILHVPAQVAYDLVLQKAERKYIAGGAKQDLHEANIEHLKRAENTYKEMAQILPDEFMLIECAPEGSLLSVEEIHEKVWSAAKTIIT